MQKNKLKIGFVFDDTLDSYDGVAQYVKTLGEWFTKEGHEVRYLVGETKSTSWMSGKIYSLSKNVKVRFNGNIVHIPLPAKNKRINQILKEENFDVLHVQMPYSPFMAQKVVKYSSKDTAVFGTFHVAPSGKVSLFGGKLLGLVQRRNLKKFDEIFSVSNAAFEYAKYSYGIDTKNLPNVIDMSKFKNNIKNNSKKPYKILFFGRLVKRKGCRELILAFARLLHLDTHSRLIIGGDGPEKKDLKKLVKRLNIEQHVEFLGFIEESKKAELLASANIACFPSLYGESFGIVLLEAMAAGAGIVLGGDNVGYRTVLSKQPKLLVDPTDTDTFTKRLQALLENKAAARKLHEWQVNEVQQYDVNTVGQRLLDAYNSAIDKKAQNMHN